MLQSLSRIRIVAHDFRSGHEHWYEGLKSLELWRTVPVAEGRERRN
jgi:hypothetical protein